MKFQLKGEDLIKARELSMEESNRKKLRDFAESELRFSMANRELWKHLEAATGYNLLTDNKEWRFDSRNGCVETEEEETCCAPYTPEQIAGWGWRPLG